MNVSASLPFQHVYTIYYHEFLGYLFESFIVQLDSQERLTFKHQNISAKNAAEFSSGLDEVDFKLLGLIDDMQQEAIVKKFYNKKISPAEFFLKFYNKEKGDLVLQETISAYIQKLKSQMMHLLHDRHVFEMGKDGEPTYKKLYFEEDRAHVTFHFRRNETNTVYFPIIYHKREILKFQFKNAVIICDEPACMLIGDKLYSFDKNVDGKKLKPFLNKSNIEVPRKLEDTYYKKFILPLISEFEVIAQGFEIVSERAEAKPVLILQELPAVSSPQIFAGAEDENSLGEDKIVFDLSFQYGDFTFASDDQHPVFVKLEKTGEDYLFHKISRFREWEREKVKFLAERGILLKNGKYVLPKYDAFTWYGKYKEELEKNNFVLRQQFKENKRYFLGKATIHMEISENMDWFDIKAVVRFGDFEIPFIKLRYSIIHKKREFKLPNGEIAVIPEEWFTQYSDLLALSESEEDEESVRLHKHHFALVQELESGSLAQVKIQNKLQQLRNFESIDDVELPKAFKGDLRPYQKAGFNWMVFLNKYHLGGCLADDMGLGKTIQTLALLVYQKEMGAEGSSLLVVPTSLVYNWELEAKKFAPSLNIFIHAGSFRTKNVSQFTNQDLIITTYGTLRQDAEFLHNHYFNYVILDESQAIKNPTSITTHEVSRLRARNRLILTGTPVENTTLDLWSQMNFVNPGLLGTLGFFKKEFLIPIEKNHDDKRIKKLHSIIKPFILRRQKSQVATELPDKVENIVYTHMTEHQEKEYEKAKSFYRNKILEEVDEKGPNNSRILLLQGLIRLRQLANHPGMVESDYKGGSGKMEDVLEMLDNAIRERHKVLVFSQFVKHLDLLRTELDKLGTTYAYLDGATRDRREQVEFFQNNPDVPLFLISLKAGGTGLNLTAADYVFILDPWWNPAAEAQAVDRAHRIGQKNTVFTYKFITKNTLEEKILVLQQNKKKLASDLIATEESFIKSLSHSDIEMLLA